MIALRECPFCGARGRALSYQISTPRHHAQILCGNCSALGPELVPDEDMDGNRTQADAVRAWNKRVGDE